jgi:hypothetical protein
MEDKRVRLEIEEEWVREPVRGNKSVRENKSVKGLLLESLAENEP